MGLALGRDQAAAEAGSGFLEGFDRGGIGAELHPDRLKGEREAAVPQLALQQIDRLTAPAEAAEDANGFGAVSFGEHRAEGRDDRRWGMAPQGGGADQQCIATADRLQQFFGGGELAVDALDPDAGAGDPLGEGVGDGGGVAVGAGEEQGHREAGAFLGFTPAAVVHQQAAPAFGDGRAMAGGDAADGELIEAVEYCFHLAGHRRHQAVIEVPPVLLGAAAVGFRPVLAAEVGREELAAHQQARGLLEGHQGTGPARGWRGEQVDRVAVRALDAVLAPHHGQGRERR